MDRDLRIRVRARETSKASRQRTVQAPWCKLATLRQHLGILAIVLVLLVSMWGPPVPMMQMTHGGAQPHPYRSQQVVLAGGAGPGPVNATQPSMPSNVAALAARGGAIQVPVIGVGCWSWGDDKGVWGWQNYDKSLTKQSISGAFNASLQGRLRLFDTAETYGSGLSEKIVGDLLKATAPDVRGEIVVATKFQPGKWANRRVREAMVQAARESCARLGVKQIDLYQIHAPLHRDSLTEQGHGLADVVEAGLARAVGVSNFNLQEVREIHAALASRGIPLATNQVEYSILRSLSLSLSPSLS